MTVTIDSEIRECPRGVHAPYSARMFVRTQLTAWGCTRYLDQAQQIASELATNAMRHGTGPLIATKLEVGYSILISVWDGNSRQFPRLCQPDFEKESGRGLFIVSSISARWGWYPDTQRGGKWTWAEVVPGEQ